MRESWGEERESEGRDRERRETTRAAMLIEDHGYSILRAIPRTMILYYITAVGPYCFEIPRQK